MIHNIFMNYLVISIIFGSVLSIIGIFNMLINYVCVFFLGYSLGKLPIIDTRGEVVKSGIGVFFGSLIPSTLFFISFGEWSMFIGSLITFISGLEFGAIGKLLVTYFSDLIILPIYTLICYKSFISTHNPDIDKETRRPIEDMSRQP